MLRLQERLTALGVFTVRVKRSCFHCKGRWEIVQLVAYAGYLPNLGGAKERFLDDMIASAAWHEATCKRQLSENLLSAGSPSLKIDQWPVSLSSKIDQWRFVN